VNTSAGVLFIGLDSADPGLLQQWGKAGLLPSLQSLRQRSLKGTAILPPGLGSGAMWVSLFTGVSPARHGRYFGRQLDGGAYRVAAVAPGAVKQEPVWLAASRAGKRVAVVDVPLAPLAHKLRGIQIKDWGCHDPTFPGVRTCPPSLANEVVEQHGYDPVGPCDRPRQGVEAYKQFRDRLLERIDKKTQLICHYLQEGGWDLFMAGFGDAHCVAHQCWHLRDPGHPLHEPAGASAYGNPVRDVYVALDRAVGRILARVAEETTVILFAGSGMGPNYTGNHLLDEALCRLEGVEPSQGRQSVQAFKDVYRKVLPDKSRSWLGPLGDRLDELSLAGDRARRKFYSIPHNDRSGAIRFNVAGREPKGRVRRGAEYDALCRSLQRDLMAVADPDTGQRVVDEVLKMSDLYAGERLDQLPDLLVVWNRDRPITALISEKTGLIRGSQMSQRTGDHTHTAAFFLAGPGILSGEVAAALRVECLAPTIAGLLNIALPNIDGRPIALEPVAESVAP
jgi:predicted AlkP superfamily phosphohydrolase/phosphomutase